MNSLLSCGSHAFRAGKKTLHSPLLPSMLCVTSKIKRGRFKSTNVELAQKVEGIRHSIRREADYESQMRVSIPETIRELRNSIGGLSDKLEISRKEFSEDNKRLGTELREDIRKLGTELRNSIGVLSDKLYHFGKLNICFSPFS